MKSCLSAFLFSILFIVGVLFIKDYLSREKFSREKWNSEPMNRYGMYKDLNSKLLGKDKNEAFEMIGDSTVNKNSDEWSFPLGSDGSILYDFVFMKVIFENGKVKKTMYKGD